MKENNWDLRMVLLGAVQKRVLKSVDFCSLRSHLCVFLAIFRKFILVLYCLILFGEL